MKELGMASGLLIAGGIPKAIGGFSDTMQLLATGLFERHGFLRLAVAGHPEGSPDIKNEAISEARGVEAGLRRPQRDRAELGDPVLLQGPA